MEGVICKETGDRKGQRTGKWLGKTGGGGGRGETP